MARQLHVYIDSMIDMSSISFVFKASSSMYETVVQSDSYFQSQSISCSHTLHQIPACPKPVISYLSSDYQKLRQSG